MIFVFLSLVAVTFGSGVFGQVPDYETTPFPPALTSFTCHGRPPGYYADVETGCKTYHVCDGISHFTYICPRRTLFQQRSRTCDYSYLVRCEDSPHFFEGGQLYRPDDEEDILRLTTTSEQSQHTEGNLEEIYNQTEELIHAETTEFPNEESTEVTTTALITTTTSATAERNRSSSVESPTVNRQPPLMEDYASQSTEKFLKVRLKDFRSLFFIPEFDNNSVVAKSEREFLLPVEKNIFIKFKTRKEVTTSLSSLCPTHCNPKYFLPGTCHPCLMIK